MKTYRIGIDCRLAGSRHAGIGRYVKNLIQELVSCRASGITWVVFFSDREQQQEVLPNPPAHWQIVLVPIRHYSLQEQLKMPAIFMAAKLDLLHVPHFNVPLVYRGKLVVTIHDLLWHEQRGAAVTTLSPLMYWFKYAFYHLIVRHAVTAAQAIFVPAQTIKTTVSKYYPAVDSKILVTYEGVEQSFKICRSQGSAHRQKNDIEVVYTGSLYPHKNIEVVLQMLQQYPDVHLTIVGSRSVFRDKVEARCRELAIQYQVTFAGQVSDQELCELYRKADALVQPSLSEGFGLTGLEALAAGLPAIVSDIPIFREIYQNSAVFFNPHDPVSVYEALKLAVDTRSKLVTNAQQVLSRYRWDKMAVQTLQQYLEVLNTTR